MPDLAAASGDEGADARLAAGEWSTRAVRDAFFASPRFPRVLSTDVIKDTIARGGVAGVLVYVGKTGAGEYDPFPTTRRCFQKTSRSLPTCSSSPAYTKVLAGFAASQGLKLNLNVEIRPLGGLSTQRLEETKVALRELGLSDDDRAL